MTISGNISIESITPGLTSKAIADFCSGLGTMFDLKIKHDPKDMSQDTLDTLKGNFKNLTAVYALQTKGSLNGPVYILLDQRGVFTLSGIIVMHPQKRINENCVKGTMDDVNPIIDAVQELGNLFRGEFDKALRDQFKDQTHLQLTDTKIGYLNEFPEGFFKISETEEFCYAPYEVTVGSYDPFVCAVIMPASLVSDQPE